MGEGCHIWSSTTNNNLQPPLSFLTPPSQFLTATSQQQGWGWQGQPRATSTPATMHPTLTRMRTTTCHVNTSYEMSHIDEDNYMPCQCQLWRVPHRQGQQHIPHWPTIPHWGWCVPHWWGGPQPTLMPAHRQQGRQHVPFVMPSHVSKPHFYIIPLSLPSFCTLNSSWPARP